MNEKRSRLQEELQQQRPFTSLAEEGVISLLKTADLIRKHYAQVVEPHGITLQQYNVLRILRGSGREGLPTMSIGERMIEETPGLTRLIDRLEAKKLVMRERRSTDRRQVHCAITETGLELLARLDAEMLAADEKSLVMLDPEGQRTLVDLLAAIRTGHDA